MIVKNKATLAALCTAGYFCLSIGAMYMLNWHLPFWMERTISVLATPAVILLTIWNPVLRPLGLTTGEWYVLPNLVGCLVVVTVYAAMAFLLAWMILRLRAHYRESMPRHD